MADKVETLVEQLKLLRAQLAALVEPFTAGAPPDEEVLDEAMRTIARAGTEEWRGNLVDTMFTIPTSSRAASLTELYFLLNQELGMLATGMYMRGPMVYETTVGAVELLDHLIDKETGATL